MTESEGSISVSVVVPTRNRARQVAECARRLIGCASACELLFIDQSDDESTESELRAIDDPRLRCVRSALRGATNGRNVGIDLARGSVIAFTDDDCRVSPDWVARITQVFESDPEAAVICGRVCVPDELQKQGFAVAFEPQQRDWVGEYPSPGRDWGLTANFAVRRSAFERVGKFDPILGPGAPLLCGEEPDFLFRVLRAGLKVVNAREIMVMHHGIRNFGAESAQLWHTYAVGTAAAFTKHVRLGDREAAKLYLAYLGSTATGVVRALLTGERPLGLGYMASFLSGTVMSFRYGVSARERIYGGPRF